MVKDNKKVQLTVERSGELKSEKFAIGSNLLQCLYKMGFYEVANTCGGRGTCRRCIVNTDDFGNVISCQTRLDENITVHLESKVASLGRDDTLRIQSNFLGNIDEIEHNLNNISQKTNLGIAIDIGTTTIVIALINVDTGDWIGEEKARNQQNGYGADVISRIDFSNKNGVEVLSSVLQNQLNTMLDNLIKRLGINRKQISVCSIAGNTVMEHFLTALSPQTIGVAPFNPLSYFGKITKPSTINLNLKPEAEIYIFPVIAGYVGGDITSGIISSGMYKSDSLNCLLDIGTNGEIVIGSADHMVSCATAAGPAFEGAEIEKGILGIPGAIDMISYYPENNKPIRFTTIEDEIPRGFCGSGLLDMLAIGVRSGLIQDSGVLSEPDEVAENLRQYLTVINEQKVIMLDQENEVYLTQQDIRKLQSAKGAIAAGLKTLLESKGVNNQEIDNLYLAGGFGSAVNVRSLAEIGMIPEVFVNKTKVLGNASLTGATMILKSANLGLIKSDTKNVSSEDYFDYLAKIREICKYIELSTEQNFMDNYIDSMFFTKF